MDKYGRKHSDEDMLMAMDRVAERIGEPVPSERQYEQHRRLRDANASLIRHRFGGWGNAKERFLEWRLERP
jgi:hypothetical protein